MTVLILGGAGYIGSHTVLEFLDRGYKVAVADNLQSGHIEALHPDAKFYCGDISDKKFLDNLFKKEDIEAVINFAANSLVGANMQDPLNYYDKNLIGIMVVLTSIVVMNDTNLLF